MTYMSKDPITEISEDCLAVRVRMLSRAVSALYDRALDSYGVTVSQVNILAFVGRAGPCSPGKIGRMLHLERSTVSRNLERMIDHAWLSVETDGSGRVREVALTASGRSKLVSVLVPWRGAQSKAAELLGSGGVDSVRGLGSRLFHFQKKGIRN